MNETKKDEEHYNKIRKQKEAENKEKLSAKQRFADEVKRQLESHTTKLLRRNKQI
jgi:hypothetical protein